MTFSRSSSRRSASVGVGTGIGLWDVGVESRSSWIGITQQPASLPSACRYTAPFAFSTSNAWAQNFAGGCRLPTSAGRSPRSSVPSSAGGSPDDAVGDEGGDLGVLVAAVLDVVQRVGARLQPLLVLLVPFGDARVQIPAVVVEARGTRRSSRTSVERLTARARGSRRRRRPPGRRCRRCSSAPRRGCRGSAARGPACRRAPSCAGGRCAPPCWG